MSSLDLMPLQPGSPIVFPATLGLDRWVVCNAGAEYPHMIVVTNDPSQCIIYNTGYSTLNMGFLDYGKSLGFWRHKKVVVRDPSIKTTFLAGKHPNPSVIVIEKEPGLFSGEICNRNRCTGIIKEHDSESRCSCHINPPCSFCVNPREYCPVCDWDAKEELDEYNSRKP